MTIGIVAVAAIAAIIGSALRDSKEVFETAVKEGQKLQASLPGANRITDRDLFVAFCDDSFAQSTPADSDRVVSEIKALFPRAQDLVVLILDERAKVPSRVSHLFPLAGNMCFFVSRLHTADAPDDLEKLRSLLSPINGVVDVHSYRTTSQLYTDYGEYAGPATRGWNPTRARDWERGTASPFVVHLTAFRKPPSASVSEWKHDWDSYQAPMSEWIQPRAKYDRHFVVERSENAPDFKGIVQESWPSEQHVEDPHLFYDAHSAYEILTNVFCMMRGVLNIIELTKLQGIAVVEYVV